LRQQSHRSERGKLLSRPFPAVLFLLAVLLLAAAALLAWVRAARDRANLVTDGARWIWFTLDVYEQKPAHFWTWRDFSLDAVPDRAVAKLFIDPRGSLAVNGSKFPRVEQRPASPLAVFDIAASLVAGTNRILIEAESQTGAGGILFCLELPGGRRVTSDSTWRIALSEAVVGKEDRHAAVWGRPPMYPWGYPRLPQ
jgi:hypothetical protein